MLKRWLAKKLLYLFKVEWGKPVITGCPEIRVYFADSRVLLLRGNLDITSKNDCFWIWEEKNKKEV